MDSDLLDARPSKKEAANKLLLRRKARRNLLDFTTFTKPDYVVNWHHRLVCSKLDQFARGEIKRLIISMPPRMGKSELVSRRLPAFIFGINPDAKIIACSYGADLASQLNRDLQRIIDEPLYSSLFPETRLGSSYVRSASQESYLRNSDIFEIVGHKGVYKSAGVGGPITGYGFDYGIIDDFFKNREEAESSTMRNKIFEWYSDVYRTRREKDASILITATRWQADDLIGRLLTLAKDNPSADQWETLTLPALSEDDRPEYDLRTDVNLSLWPDKYPEADLLSTKATVPTYTWLSLYQQRPSAATGNLFKRENFQYFKDNGDIYDLYTDDGIKPVIRTSCVVFQTCDPAGTAKSHSDFFVLSTWALTQEKDLLLLDVFRTKIEGPDHMDFIKQQYQRWNPRGIGFESVAIGKTTFQNMERAGLPVIELQPKGDKFTRALAAAIRLGQHRIYFKQGAHWLNDVEEELLHFPNAKHDDVVDTFSYADWLITEDIIWNFIPDLNTQYSKDVGYSGYELESGSDDYENLY